MTISTERAGWAGTPVAGLVVGLFLLGAASCGYNESLARTYQDGGGDDVRTPSRADAGVPYVDATDTRWNYRDTSPDTIASDDAGEPEPPGPRPLVLAHGFAGFEHLANVEQMDYYFGVEDALVADGETVVIGEVDPFNDSYDRGQELLDQIEQYLAESPFDRVNIIAHSQGGLDARFVAHHRPDLVAAVVTVSTPHGGTYVSDIILQLVDHPLLRDIVDGIVKLVGMPIYDKSGDETSMVEAFRQFSEPGIEEFNKRITDSRNVFYASVAGRTDGLLGESFCKSADQAPFLKRWEEVGDPVDPLLSLTEGVLDGVSDARPNDGLVRVSDAKWGEFWGCFPADHLDEVGQLIGDDPGGDNTWDHVEFYRNLVEYLHKRGY